MTMVRDKLVGAPQRRQNAGRFGDGANRSQPPEMGDDFKQGVGPAGEPARCRKKTNLFEEQLAAFGKKLFYPWRLERQNMDTMLFE